jgi:hypothetical protein
VNSIVDFVAGIIKLVIFASVVAGVIVFWSYNKIRLLAEGVKEALANISVSTRKKIAIINQLMEVAKDYQRSEQLTMLKTSEDLTVSSVQLANQQSGQVLAAINGVAQRFPELKSNQHYNRLMESIQQCERRTGILNFARTAATSNVFTCPRMRATSSPTFAGTWARPAREYAIGKERAFLAVPFRWEGGATAPE